MNEVKIKVDDRTKTLRFKEALTSGSRYRVVVDGGAAVCGAAGSLVVMDRGELVAFAELTDGEGELSTNTREMAEALKRMPVGASLDFDTILHKKGDAEGENVAVGICRVVAAGGAWTDDTTGALTLYKGEKGDVGATGADGKDGRDGTDGKDGRDGTDGKDGADGKSAFELAVAEGFEGTEAEWLKSLVGLPGALNSVQLIDAEGNRTSEFYEVLCKEVDGEKVLVLEQSKIDGVAAKSNAERAERAAAAAAESEVNAAESEKNAGDSAAASQTSATNAAASAAASQTSAENAADSAAASQTSADAAATSEKNAADSAVASQTSADAAAESEKSAADSAAASQTSAENAAASEKRSRKYSYGRFLGVQRIDFGAQAVTKSISVDLQATPGLIMLPDVGEESFCVLLYYTASTSQTVTVVADGETYSTTSADVGLQMICFQKTIENWEPSDGGEAWGVKFTLKRSANAAPVKAVLLVYTCS